MAALLEVKTTLFKEGNKEAWSRRDSRRETVPRKAGRRQSFKGSEKENWQGEAVWMQ